MPDPLRANGLGAGLFIGLLLAYGAVSLTQALKFDFDFKHFYRDADYVWRHGALNPDLDNPDRDLRRQLPFYLPIVPLALSPLAALGAKGAAILWSATQVAALAYCGWRMRRWATEVNALPAALPVTLALALPALYEAARFNQLSLFVLAMLLAGGAALERGRPLRAGVWLALAALLKLLPAIFFLWLLLKRRWAALGSAATVALLIGVTPCLIAFGPQAAWDYHAQWWAYNLHGAAGGMTDPTLREHFIDHRNQSIAAVLARTFWSEHPYRGPWRPFALSEETCRDVALGLTLAGAAGLALLTAQAAHRLSPFALRIELALYAIAMLALSPLVRQYYLVWAIPALALLTSARLSATTSAPGKRWALAGVIIWLLGMLAWTSPLARLYGAHLLMLLGLAACLLGLRATATLELPEQQPPPGVPSPREAPG